MSFFNLNTSSVRYLNEAELRQSEVIMIKSKADKNDLLLSLKLDKLKLADAGRVQVVANNSEGDVGSAATLTVQGEKLVNAVI